jgi:hypothetical protein
MLIVNSNFQHCRAVTLGAISSALVAFGRKEDAAGIYSVSLEAQIMAGCLVTTASAFTLYASENILYFLFV